MSNGNDRGPRYRDVDLSDPKKSHSHIIRIQHGLSSPTTLYSKIFLIQGKGLKGSSCRGALKKYLLIYYIGSTKYIQRVTNQCHKHPKTEAHKPC